jgi:hypothetical protein
LTVLKPVRTENGRGARVLCTANLVVAAFATLAPIAHVLEMPNKLTLDGPLWLAIQQNLYRGWGPFVGGPVEILALATTLALLVARRHDLAPMRLTLVAAIAYAGMIATFFVLNDPVNAALNTWTPSSIPPYWSSYRLQWEVGHALAAILSCLALMALLRAWLILREGAENLSA